MTTPIDLNKARSKRADKLGLVPCGRCGRDIPMRSTKCPECGVNFSGEAFQFTYGPGENVRRTPSLRRAAIVVGVGLVILTVYLLMSSPVAT